MGTVGVARGGVVIVGTGSKRGESWPGGERMVRLDIVLVSAKASSSQAGMSASRAPSVGCVPRTGVRVAGATGDGVPAWRSDCRRARVSGGLGALRSSDIVWDFGDEVDRIPGAPVEAVVEYANVAIGVAYLLA